MHKYSQRIKDRARLLAKVAYALPPETESFLAKHHLDIEDLGWLGSGDNGSAYEAGDGKVLKVTRSSKEFYQAQELQGKQYKHLAEIYDTLKGSSDYLILSEMIEADDSEIEYLYHAAEELCSQQGLPITYIHMFDPDEVPEDERDEEVLDFINELEDLVKEYMSLGIQHPDIKPDNLGRNSAGVLKAFDISEKG